MSALPWNRLGRRGRLRRLRRMGVAALERYPFRVERLRLLAADANTIWRVDASGGARHVLRITSPRSCHTADGTRAEVEWLRALARDTDLPLAAPVPARDGECVREVSIPGVPEPRPCAVFRWVGGRDLGDRMGRGAAGRLGALSARLHEHAREWRPPGPLRVRRHDRVFPYSQPGFPIEPVVFFDARHGALFPPARRRVFEDAIGIVQRTIDDVLATNEPEIVLHGDLHPWNVKVRQDGTLVPLDFEDLLWGQPVLDVATTLFYVELRDDGPDLAREFRAGYEEIAPWPEPTDGVLRILRAGRALLLANWVLASDETDRSFAAEYMVKTEKRLRDWLGL